MSDETRTDRLARLIGIRGLEVLSQARVMVVGIGGVGSNCTEALARGGVGTLVIIDPDEVQSSNINRQAIAFDSTVGQRKVDVMKSMILDINPHAHVEALSERVLQDNIACIFERFPIDYCIDAQDTIMTKLEIAQYCARRDIALMSSMGAANTFDPTKLAFADIYQTRSCPLSRIVRKKARAMGIERMNVLYSCEQPARTKPEDGADRSERSDLGTMSYMPAIMGQMIAARVICDILGIEWQ